MTSSASGAGTVEAPAEESSAAIAEVEGPEPRPARTVPSLARRLWAGANRHPVLVASLVALVVRLAFAGASFVAHEPVLIPDEGQYLDIATALEEGRPLDPSYEESLFQSTVAFSGPYGLLAILFGPSRWWGQFLAVLFGTVAVAMATALAGRVLRRPWPLLVGMLLALWPSQVLWSSVGLRETTVWASLAAVALGAALAVDGTRMQILAGWLLASGGLLVLGLSRQQTMVVACIALPLGVLLARMDQRRWPTATAAALLACGLPWLLGLGPFGLGYGLTRAGILDESRAGYSDFAASAIIPGDIDSFDGLQRLDDSGETAAAPVPTTRQPNQPTVPTEPASGPQSGTGAPSGGTAPTPDTGPLPASAQTATTSATVTGVDAAVGLPATTTPTTRPASGTTVVDGRAAVIRPDGRLVAAEDYSPGASEALTRGVPSAALRPYPWEEGSETLRLAGFEAPLWVALYALAAVGAVVDWRRRRLLATTTAIVVGMILMNALAQGNLGTAFRHRAQWAWALAVLGAVGASWLVDRWRQRHTAGAGADAGEAAPTTAPEAEPLQART